MLLYFCTGCKEVKNLPPKGSKCLDLTRCKSWKTLVIDAFSDTWTFLASCMAKTITEGSSPVEGWTLHSASSRRASISWIQGLAERVNSAWSLGHLDDSCHLPVLTWSPALKEVTQDQIIGMRPKPISWPADLEEEKQEALEDIMSGMEADAQKDDDVVVEFEGEFTTSQMRGVTFGDFPSDNVTSGDIYPSSELNFFVIVRKASE